MKTECLVENLYKAVNKADKISGKNLSLPVLSCLLIVVKGNTLTIKSTNLDLGMEFSVPLGKVEREGVLAVPSALLNSFLSSIQKENKVILEEVSGNLSIRTSNNSTIIKSQLYEDFPIIPRISKESSFSIKTTDLVLGLKSVWYATSVSSIKPELSSVYVYSRDSKIYFVATDSFRLAEKIIHRKNNDEFDPFLIPFKNATEIVKILEDVNEIIDVLVTSNQISFELPNFYITSRVINGAFPDYNQIIPKNFVVDIVVLKQDVLNSLKTINIFSDKFNQVNIAINPQKKTFEIKSKNNDTGESNQLIPAAITGEELEIGFNHKYLMDCFQSISQDSVSLSFAGAHKPLVIRGVSDSSFTYLVMPTNR